MTRIWPRLRREFVGIGQKIDQDLPDAAGIHRQVGQILGRHAHLQLLLLAGDAFAHHGHGGVDNIDHVARFEVESKCAALDLGNVQNIRTPPPSR